MPAVRPSSHSALVVDEDLVSGWRIAEALRDEGFAALWVTSQAAAATQLSAGAYDIVLVSLSLPGSGTVDIVRAIRADRRDAVVLGLTAAEPDAEVVAVLDSGADDVFARTEPDSVLRARVRAQVRRMSPEGYVEGSAIRVDELVVDQASRRCFVRGLEVTLRAKELDLLILLTEHQSCVVPRYEVMCQVWDENWSGSTKTLDVTMAGLRRHLRQASSSVGAVIPEIVTVRGRGYRLDPRGTPALDQAG